MLQQCRFFIRIVLQTAAVTSLGIAGCEEPDPSVTESDTTDANASTGSSSEEPTTPTPEDDDHRGEEEAEDSDDERGSCDTSEPARCEGDTAVRCELWGGIATQVSETCSGACEDGECVTPQRPSEVTITGHFGEASPIFAGEFPEIYGLLAVTAQPSFSEDLPALPRLFDASGELVSPSLGSCALEANFTLNSAQVGATLSGDTACVGVLEEAAGGFVVEFVDVPYEDGSGTLDVTLELSP